MNQETRQCQNCKQDFTIEPDDFAFYEKIKVPAPTFCPECRFQRRLLWRNERTFYHRECDLCKKKIISVYSKNVFFPVYCQKCWWSDKWDPASYGRDFDFSRPFFEQYRDFQNTVPAISIMNDDGIGSINCEYTYDWSFSKNCYLGACGWHSENCLYVYDVNHAKDIMDCWTVNNSELVYESINCDKCYNCRYCNLCFDSNDCVFGYDLKGCSSCAMCVGLRNKSYCILNKQYTKEQYKEEFDKLNFNSSSSVEKHQKKFDEFILKFPRKYSYISKSLNSTGFFLIEAKQSKNCFYCFSPIENSAFIVINDVAKDCYDCNNTGNPELCYESITPDNSQGNKFSIFCWKCTEAEYSNNCHSCTSVFGSAGLKHASYAIFNKSYPKEEFLVLREKIIDHMKKTAEYGEFFPHTFSPFAYNESPALEWYPLSKDEALEKGHRWIEIENKKYNITKKPEELPDLIEDVDDSILNEIIACQHDRECNEKCTTAFKITLQELQLYRRMNIPLSKLCPNCRHYQRLSRRNPPKLWHRQCMCDKLNHGHNGKCTNEFETSYSSDRPEIVYCEQCYNAEVA